MKTFKGGEFKNRYRIDGTLTSLSPLHIGDGEMIEDEKRVPKTEKMDKIPNFNTVMVDDQIRAYIPGSSLKGNIRSWLTQIFINLSGKNFACINDDKRADDLRTIIDEIDKKDKNKIIEKLSEELKMIEFLFGSAANEGKLEFWDAQMEQPPHLENEKIQVYSGYNEQRGTIVMKSVAIDIEKGTAAKKKLYNYETVPRGACFKITICGQNLEQDELGMLLFALQGFNSSIYPLTIGAMGGIGFGRLQFELSNIYCLDRSNYKEWIKSVLANHSAGYFNIPDIKQKVNEKIQDFKDAFLKQLPED